MTNMTEKQKQILAGKRAWRTRFKRAGLSDWHATEAAGLLACKSPERDKVRAFLLDNHGDGPMHLLSLPGSRFHLERSIAKDHKDARFTCLERDRKFIDVAFSVFSKHAPGGKLRKKADGVFVTGRGKPRTTLLNITAGEIGEADIDPLTAVWYDGMGLLTAQDFLAFLKGLKKHIAKGASIPAVFTLLQGRDNNADYKRIPGNRTSKRARKLVRLLKGVGLTLDVKQLWDYGSDSGGPVRMFNVAGMLSLTTKGCRIGRRPYQWRLVTPDSFANIKDALSEHGVAAFLGYDVNAVRSWGPNKAPDIVAQAEMLRLLVACASAYRVVPQ